MKKTHLYLPESKVETLEISKRLNRSIMETVRRMDEMLGQALTCKHLFTPASEGVRAKLRDYCEQLLFTNPVGFGRKAEDTIWRKTFYDVYVTAKRLKKDDTWNTTDAAYMDYHLTTGIGYYHHLLYRLQQEFLLEMKGKLDFPFIKPDDEEKRIVRGVDPEKSEWAQQSVHRCLVYLGDLYRYRCDILGINNGLAQRSYLQAFHLNPDIGMPHNQLGSLAGNANCGIDAVYHYMRCITNGNSAKSSATTPQPYEGVEGNLRRMFQRNSKHVEMSVCSEEPQNLEKEKEQCLACFMKLIEVFFLNEPMPMSELQQRCHQALIQIDKCLAFCESDQTNGLTSAVVFEMSAMILMCVWKQHNSAWNHISSAIAFAMAFFSQVVQHLMHHIEVALEEQNPPCADLPLPSDTCAAESDDSQKRRQKTKKGKALKNRRRRRFSNYTNESNSSGGESEDQSEVSDLSETEELEESIDSSSDSESDAEPDDDQSHVKHECNLIEANNQLNQDQHGPVVNGISTLDRDNEEVTVKNITQKSKHDSNKVLDILCSQGLLSSLKLFGDWLLGSVDVVRTCSNSSYKFMTYLAKLLNLLTLDPAMTRTEDVRESLWKKLDTTEMSEVDKLVLPEDVLLQGFPLLSKAQENLEFTPYRILNEKEEVLLRVYRICLFGKFLATVPESKLQFDGDSNTFSISQLEEQPTCTSPTAKVNGITEVRGSTSQNKLMHHMAELWLRSEVNSLESRVQKRGSGMSPYLVVDVSSLTSFLPLVKKLVNARLFIVIIPSTVVSSLDDLKRDELRAREAIRWLENQFQRGNRFVRAQRQHEHAAMKYLKYPKKKDKDHKAFFDILECCNYFYQKSSSDAETPMVTLLSGDVSACNKEDGNGKGYSPSGLARSAGINFETIDAFCTKLKPQGKSNG